MRLSPRLCGLLLMTLACGPATGCHKGESAANKPASSAAVAAPGTAAVESPAPREPVIVMGQDQLALSAADQQADFDLCVAFFKAVAGGEIERAVTLVAAEQQAAAKTELPKLQARLAKLGSATLVPEHANVLPGGVTILARIDQADKPAGKVWASFDVKDGKILAMQLRD